jgi:hypothetical protein
MVIADPISTHDCESCFSMCLDYNKNHDIAFGLYIAGSDAIYTYIWIRLGNYCIQFRSYKLNCSTLKIQYKMDNKLDKLTLHLFNAYILSCTKILNICILTYLKLYLNLKKFEDGNKITRYKYSKENYVCICIPNRLNFFW